MIAALDPVQEAAPVGVADAGAVDLPQPEAMDRIYRPRALEVPVLTPRDTPSPRSTRACPTPPMPRRRR